MFTRETDTIIASIGLLLFLAGLYLWLGLAAPLMVLGLVLIVVGIRLDPADLWSKHEPDQKSDTKPT